MTHMTKQDILLEVRTPAYLSVVKVCIQGSAKDIQLILSVVDMSLRLCKILGNMVASLSMTSQTCRYLLHTSLTNVSEWTTSLTTGRTTPSNVRISADEPDLVHLQKSSWLKMIENGIPGFESQTTSKYRSKKTEVIFQYLSYTGANPLWWGLNLRYLKKHFSNSSFFSWRWTRGHQIARP